jgi:hypothetical protein
MRSRSGYAEARVPRDDVVVDADFERLTRLAKAVRIKLGELGNTLAHLEISEQVGSNVLQPDGFQEI